MMYKIYVVMILSIFNFNNFALGESSIVQDVKLLLESKCASCHAKGNNKGGFGVVLDRDALVKQKIVVPGNSKGSVLYQMISDGTMPKKGGPLDTLQVLAIKNWIDSGAENWDNIEQLSRKFISLDDILIKIDNDLDNIEQDDPRSLPFIRYFTLTHFYNSEVSDQDLEKFRLALSRLVNSLSWGVEIVNPQPIDLEKTVLRIDLRNYLWSISTWERILQTNPYGVISEIGKKENIYLRTGTRMPYLRADWFVSKASIPPLYHDILDLPNTGFELEKKLGVNVKINLSTDQAVRSGFNKSGIASNNRILERHVAPLTGGVYWRSYDFKNIRIQGRSGEFRNFPERNVFNRPLGPSKVMPEVRLPFEHTAGELIWSLPNGLHAYMIVDGNDNRINSAPIEIVSDSNRPDKIVINGLSCMGCHIHGLIDKTDQIRETVLKNRKSYSTEEYDHILALYPGSEKFKLLLEQDRKLFLSAISKIDDAVVEINPIVELVQRFESDVTFDEAAAELGLTPNQFKLKLNNSPELSREVGQFHIEGGAVKRDLFIGLFGNFIADFELGEILSKANVLSVKNEQNSVNQILGVVQAVPVQGNNVKSKFSEADLREIENSRFITARGRQILQEHGRSQINSSKSKLISPTGSVRLQGNTLRNGAFQAR